MGKIHSQNYQMTMTNFSSLETFYIINVASEWTSGYIILGEYIDLEIADQILQENASMPCNTCGKLMIYTTNSETAAKTEWEEVMHVTSQDLQEEIKHVCCHGPGGWVDGVFTGKSSEKTFPAPGSLYAYLFGEGGEYEDLASDDWSADNVSCSLGDFNDEGIQDAICDFLDAGHPCNDIAEFKRLKKKLGI